MTILGPNGAGKTTLLKILSLLVEPSCGDLVIDGRQVKNEGERVLLGRRIGVVFHQTFLYDRLTAYENLLFYGRMYDVPDLGTCIPNALEQVGLSLFANDPVSTFSRGMQQRLSIARAMFHDPSLLILDEPYAGLDRRSTEVLSSLLTRMKECDRTILMVTHDFAQGLEQSDRVVILARGRAVYSASAAGLTQDTLRAAYSEAEGEGR